MPMLISKESAVGIILSPDIECVHESVCVPVNVDLV